jgi:hypothetical protein
MGYFLYPLAAECGRMVGMRSFVACIALIVVLVAAGCGGSSKSTSTNGAGNGEASKPAAKVLADAVKAADGASSLHMSGNVTSNGAPIGLDLSVLNGKGATGSITLKGHKVDLLIADNYGYMKADASFWSEFVRRNGATIGQLLAGKWLKFPVTDVDFQGIIAFSNPDAIFGSLQSGASSGLKNNGATTYQGQDVVALNDGSQNGTLYVSATGKPYPVALVKTGSSGGTIAFDNWNESVSLTAPSNVLDFSQLPLG